MCVSGKTKRSENRRKILCVCVQVGLYELVYSMQISVFLCMCGSGPFSSGLVVIAV